MRKGSLVFVDLLTVFGGGFTTAFHEMDLVFSCAHGDVCWTRGPNATDSISCT